jgi:hypothetical protein
MVGKRIMKQDLVSVLCVDSHEVENPAVRSCTAAYSTRYRGYRGFGAVRIIRLARSYAIGLAACIARYVIPYVRPRVGCRT